jgi:hypothetical protein
MQPQQCAERALDALSFFISDARYGLGVFLLAEHGWDPASIGAALSLGALTGLVSQTPRGALVDAVRAKRALIAGAVVVVTATCLVIPLAPRFWSVAAAGLVGALAGVTRMTVAPDPAAMDPFEVVRTELVEALARMVNRVIRHDKAEAQSALDQLEVIRTTLAEVSDPGFPIWIRPAGPKAAEMLAKLPIPSFTRRVRQDLAT